MSVLIAEAVGGLSALLTKNGMKSFENIQKPALSPPGIVFPIVWTILFALMGISAAMVLKSQPSVSKTHGLLVYVLQLLVNFFWSIFFFNLKAYGFSFFWLLLLWVLVALMIYKFSKANETAAILQIPYILWITFAAYLNYSIWMLN